MSDGENRKGPEDHLADPSDLNVWRCLGCLTDFYFPPRERPDRCPECGQGSWIRRAFRVSPTSGPPTGMTLKLKKLDKDRRLLTTQVFRHKQAGESGRRAYERLKFDRKHPDVTNKTHKVDELNKENKHWERVHDERVVYPAKHRPAPDTEEESTTQPSSEDIASGKGEGSSNADDLTFKKAKKAEKKHKQEGLGV